MSRLGNRGRSHWIAEAQKATKKAEKKSKRKEKTKDPNVITSEEYNAMVAELVSQGKTQEEAAQMLKHYEIR